MSKRLPRIKIPEIDLVTFLAEDIEVDNFWDDFIKKGDESYKKYKCSKKTNRKKIIEHEKNYNHY